MSLRYLTLTGTLLALALASPSPGAAEPNGAAGPASAHADAGVSQADLDALAYYLSSGQTAKYEAELARLQQLYPGWTPPALDGGGGDIQALWDLLAAGDHAGLDAAMARRRQAEPGWQPPGDLVREFQAAVAAERLVNASQTRQWATVVRIAAENPGLLTCERVDAVWRTAEAEAALDRQTAAETRYRTVIETCADAQIRLATIQKAKATLGLAVAEQLIAVEKARTEAPGDRAEEAPALAAVERDIAMGRLAAAAAGGEQLPAADLARLEEMARTERNAALATNLGWYAYNAGRPEPAATWFENALAWQPSTSSALGLVLARRDTGDLEGAERLAVKWQARAPRVREVLIGLVLDRLGGDGVITSERLTRYGEVAETAESAVLADALAWRAYEAGAFSDAAAWFERSLAWAPSAKAAEGLVLALRQAGEPEAANRALSEAVATYPELGDRITSGGLTPAIAAAAAERDYEACVRAGLSLRRADRLAPGDAQQFGWCLLALDRPTEALLAFDTVLAALGGEGATEVEAAETAREARLGRAYAQLGLGQATAVAAQLARGELSGEADPELRALVLAQFARDAANNGEYATALAVLAERRALATPSRDLRALEGWTYYHLNDNAAAERIFSRLNAEFSTEETRHALSVVRRYTHGR